METGEEPPELLSPTFTETHLGAKLTLTFDQNRIPATSKKFSNVLNACKPELHRKNAPALVGCMLTNRKELGSLNKNAWETKLIQINLHKLSMKTLPRSFRYLEA